MEGDIVRMSKYDYDKYFSIAVWVKSGVSRGAKVKEKYYKITQGN